MLERRGVTLDTTLRLDRYLGGDAQSWLNLQNAYDLKNAQKELAPKISKEVSRWRRSGGNRENK